MLNKIIILITTIVITLNNINEVDTNEISGFRPMTEELKLWREAYCLLPKAEGNCIFYYMPAFYYNSDTGTCDEFAYGGCNGNHNRFPTKETCERTCDQNALSYKIDVI